MKTEKPLDPKLFRGIKALLLDADGVLTDGSIIYDGGGREVKVFSVRDGLGIRLLADAGIPVGILTGRSSPALRARCENLSVKHLWDGVSDKADFLAAVSRAFGAELPEICYVGDDLPDIPVMLRVGLPVAVADAHPEAIAAARAVTLARGGRGAVREVCEAILRGRGLWDKALARFTGI